jgi:hypothetical protein
MLVSTMLQLGIYNICKNLTFVDVFNLITYFKP